MVAFTALAATNMNDPIGSAIIGNPLSDFSNESPSGFTVTAAPVSFAVTSLAGDFFFAASLPFSGTITGIAESISGLEQWNATGLDISIGSVFSSLGANLALSSVLAGDDTISGSPFADLLTGLGGNDAISGAGGNDTLIGGPGSDTLTGGRGADRFLYQAVSDSAAGPTRDVITDFHEVQHDRIDLHLIDADQRASHPGNQAFVFIGTDSFAHYHSLHRGVVGMVRFNPHTHVLQGNVDASLAPDFEIAVPHVASLVAGDFIL